jgi:hypothetical protein
MEGCMKSLVALAEMLLRDISTQYSLDSSRDLETLRARHGKEGEPFLTITLDAYRVAFEAALEAGTWDNILIPGFRKDGRLPAFLRGFVSLVFQRNGQIRSNPDWTAVKAIRQLTGFAAKMRVECDPRYTLRAISDFKSVDARAVTGATPALKAVFADLFDGVMRDVETRLDNFDLHVKHGDGASQDKLLPNSRWKFPNWEEGLEPFFPSYEYAYLNPRHALVDRTTEAATQPVRVEFVPKTAKGPRTIAIEPSWKMYCQQGLWNALAESIERRGLPPRFSDSSKNRTLAREGSVSREIATIDLSAASDSVSSRLVWELTSGRPEFRAALFAARSSQATLPDGTTLTLNKFASMGAATCFPIEAMVFAAIAVYAMAPRLTSGSVSLPIGREVVRRVTVYGDDIVVPSTEYSAVVDALKSFGFSVNAKKSFVRGFFRESCGGDYFQGHDVSYVKVRRPLGFSTTAVEDTVSTVSLRNKLAESGLYPLTVGALDRELHRGLRIFPSGSPTSPGLVRTHDRNGVPAELKAHRHSPSLQRGEVKAWVQRSEFRADHLDGLDGLHKSLRLAERLDSPSEVPANYESAGRSVRVRLTAQWVPVA